MKIIVVSDTHGNVYNLRQVLTKYDDAEKIIFLGDGERDFEYVKSEIAGRELIMVKGNCDFGSDLNTVELLRINDNLVLCMHGHTKSVKYGNEMLIEEARTLGAKLVLYGHTHEQYTDYNDGLYIMNPGSLNNYQFGIIDIQKNGIILNKMDLLQR